MGASSHLNCGSAKRFHRPVENKPSGTMADDEPTFESTESGASHTYPQQAGTLRKGSHVMIKGKPCKVTEVTTSKTGKHGHAKAHIVALDIFTKKKYEDLCPCSHNMHIPFVKNEEYQVMNADRESGETSLLNPETSETRDDLFLPKMVQNPTDEDMKLSDEICDLFDKGEKTVVVIIQSACGIEKIISQKTI